MSTAIPASKKLRLNDDPEMLTCKACDKEYADRSSYLRHVREIHEGTKRVNTQTFTCNVIGCNESYTSAQNLKGHIERDHRGCVNACDLCDATFGTKANLFTHKKVTHGIGKKKEFKCVFPGCGYTTPYSKSVLQRHVERNHAPSVKTSAPVVEIVDSDD